jgi:acid phosphatase type 7
MACTPSPAIDDGGADAARSFTYAPVGCPYTVTPPLLRGYQSLALDDGAAITDVAGATPARVRIGLGGPSRGADPTTTASFTWDTPAQVNAAQVRIGTSMAALTTVQKGYVWQTPPPTMGLGSAEPAANMHEVHVCGLSPATTYTYQVGGGPAGQDVWSAPQTFTTLPASGTIVVGVSGDARDSASIFQLLQERMRDAAVSMQIFSGDLILIDVDESLYASWLTAAWTDPSNPSAFLTLGQELILPVAGNHEDSSPQFYGNFSLPGDGPYAESFYSVDIGPAHVVMLDDQQLAYDTPVDEAQAALSFIDADLTAAEQNRANVPFLLAVHHRSEFGNGSDSGTADVIAVRNALNPLWDKHKVDLVINGHEHDYERTLPITGPPVAPVVQASTTSGTTYAICGGAGADADPPHTATTYDAANLAYGGATPYVGVYALMELDAHTLTWTAYGLQASGTDPVVDTFTLTR